MKPTSQHQRQVALGVFVTGIVMCMLTSLVLSIEIVFFILVKLEKYIQYISSLSVLSFCISNPLYCVLL